VPELPEVETMRRMVVRELLGRTLAAIDLRLPKLTRDSPLPDLDLLVGHRVLAARRRAKVLVIDWSDGLSTMTHFKLAGQLAIVRATGERIIAGHPVPHTDGPLPHKSTHLTLRFADGTIAYYSDIRQFGWWRLLPTDAVDAALAAFAFGPEGVGPEAITLPVLGDRLAKRRIPLKVALLDQKVVAGLGNIYVDEALHRARLHPVRPANSLTADELGNLHKAIAWALERGIEQGGARIIRGRAHPMDGFPAVHGRQHEVCDICGAAIVKTRVGNRGTYLCPVCQPLPDL
jgi:formamidopyrimidine-DNA glycosylase